ncbi:hypothetical protein HI914_01998 [Erysiphe necator]|nr:hypothetical protein HI914_01998 [Erysiphe necator]
MKFFLYDLVNEKNFLNAPNKLIKVERSSLWETWNGSITSIDPHVFQIKLKLEEHKAALGVDLIIYFKTIEDASSDRHPRIITGSRHVSLINQLRDKKASRTDSNLHNVMIMTVHEQFSAFMRDFDIRLSLCGGQNRDNKTKIYQLETVINT